MATESKTPKKSNLGRWLKLGLIIAALIAVVLQVWKIKHGLGWVALETCVLTGIWIIRDWLKSKIALKKEKFPLKRSILIVVLGTLAFWNLFGFIIAGIFVSMASFGLIWIYPTRTERLEKILGIGLISFWLAVGLRAVLGTGWSITLLTIIAVGLAAYKYRWHPKMSWTPWYNPTVRPGKSEEDNKKLSLIQEAIEAIRADEDNAWQTFGALTAELGLTPEDINEDLRYRIESQTDIESVAKEILGLSEFKASEAEDVRPKPWITARKWVLSNVHPSVLWSAGFFIGFAVLTITTSKWGISEWFNAAMLTAGLALVISIVWWQIDLRTKLTPYFHRQPKAITPKPDAEPAGEQTDDDDEEVTVLQFFQEMGKYIKPTRREKIGISAILLGVSVLAALLIGLLFTMIFVTGHRVNTHLSQPTNTPLPTRWPTAAPSVTPQPGYDDTQLRDDLGMVIQAFGYALQTPQAETEEELLALQQEDYALEQWLNILSERISTLEADNAAQATTIATLQTPAPTNTPTPTVTPSPTATNTPTPTVTPTPAGTATPLPTIGPANP